MSKGLFVNWHLSFFFCFIIALLGCKEDGIVYLQKQSIPDYGWAESDHLTFDNVSIKDGDVYIQVEHETSYGYQNIYLKGTIIDGVDTIDQKVFSIPLMNQHGHWAGITTDDVLSVQYPYPIETLPINNTVSIDIQQYSRDVVLRDIKHVTLLVKSP